MANNVRITNSGKVYIDGMPIDKVSAIEFSKTEDSMPEVTLVMSKGFEFNDFANLRIHTPWETELDVLRSLNFYAMLDDEFQKRCVKRIIEALDENEDCDSTEELAELIFERVCDC